MENSEKQNKPNGLSNNSFILKTAEIIYVLSIADIIRCEAIGNYTKFHLKNQQTILISKTLKHYDKMLKEHGFFRLHRSHLINLNYLDKYHKRDGGTIIMKDNSTIPVAFRKKHLLLKALKTL